MKFVAISDTHCRHHSLRLPKGDVLLHAGDISYRGEKTEIIDFLNWFSNQPFEYKIFIAGNHDFFFEKEKEAAIRAIIPSNVTYLKDSSITVDKFCIWGSPYTPHFFRWAFNKHRGKPLNDHWAAIPAGVDVLMTHGPAYGVLDMVVNEEHAGDKALWQKCLEVKPKVHVCGHIHESYGTERRKGIQFINACILNESYELRNKPISFELK